MKKILLFNFFSILFVFVIAQSPVAYYPFNGNANDAVGANNGIVNGATLTTDRFNNPNSAYSFDGVDDQIDLGPFFTEQNFTIAMWLKPGATQLQHANIIDNNHTGLQNWVCQQDVNIVNRYNFGVHTSSGGVGVIFSLAANIWQHLVLIKSATSIEAYVNGLLVQSAVWTGSINYTGQFLRFGNWGGNGRCWNGSMDEVKIFNTALTAAQVQNEMGNELPLPIPVLSGGPNGTCGNNQNNMNGGTATGFGCGGGGGGWYGGNGGNGLFGGGGGGAAGLNQINKSGGSGGNGAVVVQMNNAQGDIIYRKLFINGTQFTIPANVVQVKVWAIGAGGGGAGATNSDGTSGGGGGAGGTAFKMFTVNSGDNISYSIGIGGAGGIDVNNGSAGTATVVTYNATILTGNGGNGGQFNNGVDAAGGIFSGGDGGSNGGNGKGTGGDTGGGAGGGLGGGFTASVDCSGGTGADAVNISNLFEVLGYREPIQKPGSGNAISFDGVDDVIDIASSTVNNFTLNQNFTVECWVKIPVALQPNEVTESASSIIEKWNGVAGGYPYTIRYRNGNPANVAAIRNKIEVARWNGVTYVPFHSVVSVNDDKYHHISFIKTGTLLSLYIDGVLQSTATDLTSGQTDNNDPLHIGGRTAASPLPLNGIIDEVRIWNTALTELQVRDRMCKKITTGDALYANLAAYYNFDETNSNTLFDATINKNDGVLINNSARITSGAAIGIASSHDYINTIKTTSLAHATGESFTVTSTSGLPNGIHVYRIDEQPNTLNGAVGVGINNKYFGVFQVGGTTPQYTALYNYSGNPGVSIGNEFQLRLNKRTDNAATAWTMLSNIPNETANTISVTGESTEYILGKLGAVLPVSILSFSGTLKNQTVELQWKVMEEINTAQFVIERSNGNVAFGIIGTRLPLNIGNTDYTLTDNDPFVNGATQYYRLKVVDKNGSFKYSNIIRVSNAANIVLSIFPNPAKEVITISGSKKQEAVIINNLGQVMASLQLINGSQVININTWPSGVYFIKTTEAAVKFIKE